VPGRGERVEHPSVDPPPTSAVCDGTVRTPAETAWSCCQARVEQPWTAWGELRAGEQPVT